MPSFESLPEQNPAPQRPAVKRVRRRSAFDYDLNSVQKDQGLEVAQESSPKVSIFDNITFTEVYDGRGDFKGYKSSALGRKRMVLQETDELILPDLPYRVEVISDSEPSDPEKGFYTVKIIPDDLSTGLLHKEAAHKRAARLRKSHGFKVLGSMINSDPDLSAEYRPVVARHQEFKGNLHKNKDDRHRNFTGMISGLMMSERGNALLNQVIDRTVQADTLRYKALLESKKSELTPPYTPGVIIGTGIYASILASTRQMYLPGCPDLALDQEDSIGGQFSQYGAPLFRLNSRNRPELVDQPHLPGGQQSLNSSGNYGVMQQADMSGLTYGDQSTAANQARINFFLSGRAVTGVRVTKIRRNPEGSGSLIVEAIDEDTRRIYEVATDRVTFATGVGKEVSRLDENDVVTSKILEEEALAFKKSNMGAQVYSATQFYQRLGDKTTPFPLQGIKKLILSGEGDSATVVAGLVLGYETQVGKTMTQLDNVEEIIWLGQSIESKEEFLQTSRARYAQVGLEFPRTSFENYYHRIKPYPNVRSQKLRRGSEGKIRVIVIRKNETSNSFFDEDNFDFNSPLTSDEERYVEGDCFVYAHGFEDTTDEIVRPTNNQFIFEKGNVASSVEARLGRRPFISLNSGDTFYFYDGPFKRIEVLKGQDTRTDSMVCVGIVDKEMTYQERTIPLSELSAIVIPEKDKITRVELSTFVPPKEIVQSSVRGKTTRIAERYAVEAGDGIYKVGPAANLPLSEGELADAPVLGTIQENAVAIFRYVDRVEAFARRSAQSDIKRGRTESDFSTDEEAKDIELPRVNGAPITLGAFTIQLQKDSIESLGLKESTLDMLKLAIGDILSPYLFPDALTGLEMKVMYKEVSNDYTVEIEPALPTQYVEVLTKMLTDPLVGGIIKKITDNNRARAVNLAIPLLKRKVNAVEVSFTIPTKK